ncbi:hypothetical protein LCGC14_2449760 [marine sediment metagenome]|uniref:Uncharacterized protein n=1 Tax=marine sediment metagenome TaxID=412755 RepID=A0A0F9BGU1_9ZZZZ
MTDFKRIPEMNKSKDAVLRGTKHIRDCVEKGQFIRQWWLKEWLEQLRKYHEDCETVANDERSHD